MTPGPRTISQAKIGIWLPDGLREALEESARRNGRTMSGEARWAITRYLNANADTTDAAPRDGNRATS